MGEACHVTCCIAGGGPAGLMLGLLLARAGVAVWVLEKHADFLRDFRGDTIHPSTLEVMHELGLAADLLRLPHEKVARLGGTIGTERVAIGDFRHLPVQYPFVAMMPQWDFLNFLAGEASRYPHFRLDMRTAATGLIERDGTIAGASAVGPAGRLEIAADLVVACDGRGSVLRRAAGLEIEDLGAPMDALWFRLEREAGDEAETMGIVARGRILVLINRGTHWQTAFVIPKGSLDELKAQGLDAFRRAVAALLPLPAARLDAVASWDDVKLLVVKVDRLKRWWRPGFLAIGDAAHAMSPIGGVGINLAIQDAVAAANILAAPLKEGRLQDRHLAAIEARRMPPTRRTQRMQVVLQKRVISSTLGARDDGTPLRPPWPLRLLQALPILQRLPARLIGLGLQPEHVSEVIRRGGRG